MTPPPTLRITGAAREALAPGILHTLTDAAIRDFLRERRWFGAKGRPVRSVRIAEAIPLTGEEPPAVIVRLDVEIEGGRVERYQLPLVLRSTAEAGDAIPRALLARVESRDGSAWLFDGVEDAGFRRLLGRALEHASRFESGGAAWIAEPIEERVVGLGAITETRVMAAEQSNTSIVFGDRAILKLFRRLEPGENPDVEISRHLTLHTGFRHTPPLLGTLRMESADGGIAVAGMLQQFLPGVGDAWSYALDRARPYFRGDTTRPENAFAPDAERLGFITRELHEALAGDSPDPAFAPVATTGTDVESWAAAVRSALTASFALLDRRLEASTFPPARVNEARALARRRGELLGHLDQTVRALGSKLGDRIRHHGDYHLGQVLRTTDGDFMIIDFEGEPARPLAERRALHCALRDVAGMLRSFAYAAATLAVERREAVEPAVLEPLAARWEREVREAFLTGYARDAHSRFLPASPADASRLLELFEMEKVFYELGYELDNRPDWAWIPMRGVSKLLAAPGPARRA